MGLPVKLRRLRIMNNAAAVLHFGQALIVVWLSRSFPVAVSGSFLKLNALTHKLEPTTSTLFTVQIAWLIAVFFLLSALFHFLIATVYNKRYNLNLLLGINKMRWAEYSLSASVMMVAIAILVGVYDFASLLMIFALTAIMNLMGLVMEIHNQSVQATNWTSYYVGCFAGAVPWSVVALYLWLGATHGSRAPTFVYWIFVSIFIFFTCFAANMVLQYKRVGPWREYVYGERVYIILSLVAKSLLAWQVFAGTLRP